MSDQTIEQQVDLVLTRAGLSVTPEERDWLIQTYPLLQDMLSKLRVPEARYAEPALIYAAELNAEETTE